MSRLNRKRRSFRLLIEKHVTFVYQNCLVELTTPSLAAQQSLVHKGKFSRQNILQNSQAHDELLSTDRLARRFDCSPVRHKAAMHVEPREN